MAADEEWDITSLNSVPLSTTSDWEILSNGDDCAYHSDDELLSLRSMPPAAAPLTRQRSSSADSGVATAAPAASDGTADEAADDGGEAQAEIERLRRQLRESQAQLQRAQTELESTHVEVADAVASNTVLQRELEQQRERSARQIVEMKASAEEQQRRINELNRQLIISALFRKPQQTTLTLRQVVAPRRGDQRERSKERLQRKHLVSAAVRSRPAKKWFASHNHRSQYAGARAPRGQKVSKRRGNDRH